MRYDKRASDVQLHHLDPERPATIATASMASAMPAEHSAIWTWTPKWRDLEPAGHISGALRCGARAKANDHLLPPMGGSETVREAALKLCGKLCGRQGGNLLDNGRSGRIRTCDPLVPNEVRYQAALHSDSGRSYNHDAGAPQAMRRPADTTFQQRIAKGRHAPAAPAARHTAARGDHPIFFPPVALSRPERDEEKRGPVFRPHPAHRNAG